MRRQTDLFLAPHATLAPTTSGIVTTCATGKKFVLDGALSEDRLVRIKGQNGHTSDNRGPARRAGRKGDLAGSKTVSLFSQTVRRT